MYFLSSGFNCWIPAVAADFLATGPPVVAQPLSQGSLVLRLFLKLAFMFPPLSLQP